MSKSFTTMVANVGGRVGDTSTTFATKIGTYINDRYEDVLGRINWNIIDEDYSFNTVAGTQDYALPTDFNGELYVYDSTNKKALDSYTLQELAVKFPDTLETSGTVDGYAIYDYIATGVRSKKIRLHQIPTAVVTIKMPYIVGFSDISSTSTTIIACERIVELGATADAWRTKRQFAKGADFDGQYERAILNLMFKIENQPNLVRQANPYTYDREIVG